MRAVRQTQAEVDAYKRHLRPRKRPAPGQQLYNPKLGLFLFGVPGVDPNIVVLAPASSRVVQGVADQDQPARVGAAHDQPVGSRSRARDHALLPEPRRVECDPYAARPVAVEKIERPRLQDASLCCRVG